MKEEKCCEVAPSKPKPTLYINSEDFPSLKNAKIGQTFSLNITAKLVSINQNKDEKGKINHSGSLEIQSMDEKNKSAFDKNWDKYGDE